MSLFGFDKKKETASKTPICACDNKPKAGEALSGIQSMKVLGSGCKSCHALLENAKAAITSTGLDIEVEYVTDLRKIMEYGVMSMPALVINEKVVSMGKVLKSEDIRRIMRK